MKIKRGIILRPTIRNNTLDGRVDDQLLRKLVLYWDLLDYPFIKDNSTGLIIGRPDERFFKELPLLKQEGILQESYIAADDNSAEIMNSYNDFKKESANKNTIKNKILIDNVERFKSPFGTSQIELCKHKNSIDTNTIWSIGDLNDDISKMFFGYKEKDAIQMEFYNFLPVPKKEVPMEKILEFKSKRESEILHLRFAVDEMTNIVLNSENLETEMKKKKEEIDRCLLGLHKILDESNIQKISSNLNTYLNIKENELIKYLAQAGGIAVITDNLIFGLVSGIGINVLLKICSKKVSKIDGLPEDLRNFIYVYEAETKLK